MAFPNRAHTVAVWDNPPPPGAEEFAPVAVHQPTKYQPMVPDIGCYSGPKEINMYTTNSSNVNYISKNNDYHAHDRFSTNRSSNMPMHDTRNCNRSRSPSPQARSSKSRYSKERLTSERYSRDRSENRHSRSSRRSVSRNRRRSRSSSRYHRKRSRSSSRRRYRRSRSTSRPRYSNRRHRSRSRSPQTKSHTRRSRNFSHSRSASRSYSRSPNRKVKRKTRSPSSSRDNSPCESPSRLSDNSSVVSGNQKSNTLTHKEFIQKKAQEYASKHQTSTSDSSNTFKNDGSFLEMFKKLQEDKEKKVDEDKDTDKPEKILNIVAAASSLLDPTKPPAIPIVCKRRGGRVLKTGIVEKKLRVVQDEQPTDAWAVYMKEVKRYKEACCDVDSKTRPLTK